MSRKEWDTGQEGAEVLGNTGPEGERRGTKHRSDMQGKICTESAGLPRVGGGSGDHRGLAARLGLDEVGDNIQHRRAQEEVQLGSWQDSTHRSSVLG